MCHYEQFFNAIYYITIYDIYKLAWVDTNYIAENIILFVFDILLISYMQ